jgi:hypothetical protein
MRSRVALLLITIASVTGIPQVKAQNTTLTYQGRLFSTGGTANGSYDLSFALFDASSNGLQQGVSLTNTATAVSNGLFTVQLDFGDQFNGANRWLEIAVRTNGASGFSKLVPRQPLSPTPYAIYSANAGIANSVAATNIVGHLTGTQLPPEVVTNRGSGLILSGTFAGNGGSVSNVNASTLNGMTSTGFWTTTGNASTHSGANFLGTTDAQPLNLQANGQTVLHLEGDPINGARITSGTGSLVSSNAANSSILGGKANMIEAGAIQCTISGGLNNSIRANQQSAFIGGGARNSIQGGDEHGVIVGGRDNWIGTNCIINAILGGAENRLDDNIDGGMIGAGFTGTDCRPADAA